MSLCRVGLLPLGEFTVMITEPHATLQGAITWRNQCHDRATLQGVRIPSAILKIVFRYSLFFCFLSAVWALTSSGFRIVSDTLLGTRYYALRSPNDMSCLSVCRLSVCLRATQRVELFRYISAPCNSLGNSVCVKILEEIRRNSIGSRASEMKGV